MSNPTHSPLAWMYESMAEDFRRYTDLFRVDDLAAHARDPRLAALHVNALLVQLILYLNELDWRALDSDSDANSLIVLALRCNKHVMQLAEKRPARVARVAERMMEFPCNWPALKSFQKQLTRQLQSLGWGKKAMFKVDGRKQFDPGKLANRVALELIPKVKGWKQTLERELMIAKTRSGLDGAKRQACAKSDPLLRKIIALKPYSRQSAKAWAVVVWELVMRYTNNHPEAHPQLWALGECRRRHSEYRGQQRQATPRTENANIRQRIKERIQKATVDLAARQ